MDVVKCTEMHEKIGDASIITKMNIINRILKKCTKKHEKIQQCI